MTDRSDAIVITEEPEVGAPRRTRYEPTSDGGFERVEEVWMAGGCEGGTWHTLGRQRLAELAVDGPAEVRA